MDLAAALSLAHQAMAVEAERERAPRTPAEERRVRAEAEAQARDQERHAAEEAEMERHAQQLAARPHSVSKHGARAAAAAAAARSISPYVSSALPTPPLSTTSVKSFAAAFGAISVPSYNMQPAASTAATASASTAAHAPRTARRHALAASSSMDQSLPHPFAAIAHTQAASAAQAAPAGSSRAVPPASSAAAAAAGFHSLHKGTDAASLSQLWDESRLALQFGRPAAALSILQFLDQLCKQSHLAHQLPLQYLMAVCRREMGQETLALTALAAQMKINEAQGLHSAAVRLAAASSTSPGDSHQSSASELLPHPHAHQAHSAHVMDPDVVAPSLACEFERGLAYEALSDPDGARRSARSFSRLVDSTSMLPDLVDNAYPAWMALAKWLANIGLDSRARAALQRAAEVHSASKGGSATAATSLPLIPDPHWLLLSIYVEWSLGAYDRAEALASFLLHAPPATLTPLNSSDAEDSERQLQALQSKAALFLAASTMALAAEPSSAAFQGTGVAAAAPSTLDSAARLLDSLLAHPLQHSLELQHAAAILQSNLALLRGSSLRPAIQSLHRANQLETQMQQHARERAQVHASAGAQQQQQSPSPPRFPFFGPLAHSAVPSSASAALPPASKVCMYDLRRANNAWQARSTAASSASAAAARGSCPSPVPNFDLLCASGGINPVHYSARYLSVLVDLYSDLLLRYGIEGQARILFYRSNLYALLGQPHMQLHDLEILHATAPGWFSAYVQSQTALDFPDLSTTAPVSRVAVVSTLHVHLTAQCFGGTLFDKSVAQSNGNLLALEKKIYTGLARIGGPASNSRATMPPSTVGPFTQVRAWVASSSNLSVDPEPHSAPIRVATAVPRVATASSTGNSSRASTSYASSRPAPVFSSGQQAHGSLAAVSGGGSSNASEWDSIPTGGLLDCEDALYFDAIVADLTRQHAACSFNHSSAVQGAMLNQAQEAFEQILKITAAAATTPPVSSSSSSPPAVVGASPSSIATILLCTEGLAMLLHHRLKFVGARHLIMEGMLTVWSAVEQSLDARAARQERKQKEAADDSNKVTSTPKLNAQSLEQQDPSRGRFTTRPPRAGLSGSAIVGSTAPFHVKALKLSAPLLASLDDEDDPDADLPMDAGTVTRPISRDGTTYTASSYWGSERSAETSAPKRKHDGAATDAAAVMATPAWLEPSRLLMGSLRRHCATLLSLLGIGYALEANTDTSLLLLYRALALDAHDLLGNLYLFLHHFRFSPLHLAAKHYLTLCEAAPLFIPGLDTIAYSPVRYPLQEDRNFSQIARGEEDEEDDGDANRTPERAESAFPLGSPRARPIADPSTLAYPFPVCSARCLTSRLMDRPYMHTSSPEVSAYLHSICSHIQAVKHRNALAILNQRQNEVVDRTKSGDTTMTRASIKGMDNESAAALMILHAQAGSELSSSVPLVLSLTNLHPTHVLHPLQQRNKFKFDASSSSSADSEQHGEEEKKNPASILKPSKPTGSAAKSTGRSAKVASAGANKKASSAALAAASEPKITFDPSDPSATRNLPPFLHVEHRAYHPSVGSAQWTAAQWYKESLKLLSFCDKNGLALAFLKCLHLDVDYCASLNYVLSLLETNLSESSTEDAEAQAKRDWVEIEALEAAAASGSSAAAKSSPKNDRKLGTSGGGINKHTPQALAAMFGRDKSLPIVWDLYSRGKQWEELYGLSDLAFADYSYALHFLPLGDILWRRGLLCKSRRHTPQAISDLSEAIRQTMLDRSFLEKIPAASGAQKKPVLEEVKSHMNDKQRKEVEAANAAKLLAAQHSPQNSLNIVCTKLSQYHLVRGILVFNAIPAAAHAGAHSQYTNADSDASESLKLAPKNPVALRLHSLCLTHLGKYSDAARALEKYLELQPRDWGSRMRLASLWSYAGSYDKALAGFNKLLSHAPHNAAVHYAKALVYFRQHMWHEAHDVLQTAISLAPKYWLAYMRQGEVLERLESYELAIETLQMALAGATAAAKAASNPVPVSSAADDSLTLDGDGYTDLQGFHLDFIHKTLGRIYLAQAQQSYMAFLAASEEERKSKAKKKSSALMEQSESSGTLEDGSTTAPRPPSRAKDLWGEAVSGTAKELKLLKVASSHRAASIRSAHLSSEEVLAAASATGSKSSSKKTVEYVSKCLHMALQSLQQAVVATPGVADAESHYLLALTILFLAGNRQRDPGGKVWALLQRVVSLQPQHAEARFVRGFLLQREGRLDEAAKELDLCLSIEPEHVLALQARSYLHFLSSEKQKSQETYSKMINQPGPLRAVAYANRGLVHFLNGSVQNALADLDYAISVAPMHALAWLYRAELHKTQGNMNEAIADYRMAAPLLKAKLEEAELERKQMESPFGRRATHNHARNASTFGSFSGMLGLNRPSSTQAGPATATGGSSLFAKEGEFRRAPSPLSSPSGGYGMDSFEPAAPHGAAHHTRSASSGSMTLTLPAGFSSITLSREGSAAPPHVRRSAVTLWRAIRDLVQSKQFTRVLALTPSPASAASETIVGLPVLTEFSAAVHPLSSPPPIPAPDRERIPVPLVSQIDIDSLHLPLIHGGEHFRLHGTRESALQFQSEVGLTSRDLDSVHNSLGILLHQQADIIKKKAAQAAAAGGARMGDEIKKQKAAAAAAAAQRRDGSSGSGGPLAPLLQSSSIADSSPEDVSESLHYFSSNSSHFEAHYNRALIFLETGHPTLALGELKSVVERAPEFANGHNNLGVCLEGVGDLEKASEHYTLALQLTGSRHLIAAFNLANTKNSSQRFQEAIKLYTIFLRRCKGIMQNAAAAAQAKRGAGGAAAAGAKATESSSDATLLSHPTHSEDGSEFSRESDPTGPRASFLPAKKSAEFLRPFEREMQESLEREEAEKTPRSLAAAKAASVQSAAAQAQARTDAHLQALSRDESNLAKLIPLALNNRAIAYQNLGLYDRALRDYTRALQVNPSLSYIKFNRAHLHMVQGDCFGALEDIRAYAQERAKNEAATPDSRLPLDKERERPQSKETVVRTQSQTSGSSGGGGDKGATTSPPSSTSLAYLQSFSDYCQRFQWGLAVACKDLMTGLKVLPIVSSLNVNVPANPLVIFNPHMLGDAQSGDWKRLRDLVRRASDYPDGVRTEFEIMSMGAGITGAPVSSLSSDSKLKAVLAPSSMDSPFIAHVKMALKAQVHQQYSECLDALLKAIYLLPPSPQYLEQQRADFARRHNLSGSVGHTLDSALLSVQFPPDAGASVDLAGELHEVLVFWRARLLVFLGNYDAAVADMEFHTSSMRLGAAQTATHSTDGLTTARRKKPRIGLGDGLELSDEDEALDDNEDLTTALGLSSALSSIGMPAASSSQTNHSTPRAQSRAETHQRTSSTASSVASKRVSSAASVALAPSFRSIEDEQAYHMQQAHFAHRAAVRNSRLLCYLGSLYHMRRRDSDALRVYTAAIALDPHNFYALLNRTLVHRLQGRFSNAIADLFDVVKILAKMDEKQRAREAKAKALRNGEIVPPPTTFEPEIDCGLHVAPSLKLTRTQQSVYSVLQLYVDTLKLNPQEHWDSITSIQGRLAMAVDAALAERQEKKKQRMQPAIAGGGKAGSKAAVAGLSAGADDDDAEESKLSTAQGAQLLRQQLDSAADKLMEHMIDPKLAREKQAAALQQERSGSPVAIVAPGAAAPLHPLSTLALAGMPFSAPAPVVPDAGAMLDLSFEQAFANMQSLIHSQLPKKMTAPTANVAPAGDKAAPATAATATVARTTTTTTTTTTKTVLQVQSDPSSSSASLSSVPSAHFHSLMSGLREREKKEAAEAAAAALAQAHAAQLYSSSSGAALPAQPASARSAVPPAVRPAAGAAAVTGGRRGRVGMSLLPAQAPKPPVPTQASARAARAGSVVVSSAEPQTASTAAPAASTHSSVRPPVAPRPIAPDASALSDDAFAASLDPHLPAAVRARLLEDRRQLRISEVRNRFAGTHARSASFYGLLENHDGQAATQQTTHDAFDALHAEQQTQLRAMALASLEADDGEAFDDREFDDE